jgi:hypothetical protein
MRWKDGEGTRDRLDLRLFLVEETADIEERDTAG